MGTRSWIGYVTDDGSVRYIYCHSDGYIENNGLCLLGFYNARGLARDLVDGGNASYLAQRQKDVAYYKSEDAREDSSNAIDTAEFLKLFQEDIFIEFAYLFKDGEWFVAAGWVDDDVAKKATHFFFETERLDIPLGNVFPPRLVKLSDAVAAYAKYSEFNAKEDDRVLYEEVIDQERQPTDGDWWENYFWEYGRKFESFDPGEDPRDERIRNLTLDEDYAVSPDETVF